MLLYSNSNYKRKYIGGKKIKKETNVLYASTTSMYKETDKFKLPNKLASSYLNVTSNHSAKKLKNWERSEQIIEKGLTYRPNWRNREMFLKSETEKIFKKAFFVILCIKCKWKSSFWRKAENRESFAIKFPVRVGWLEIAKVITFIAK